MDDATAAEPDPSAASKCSPDAQRLLSQAGALSREIRTLRARILEAARERRRVLLAAYEQNGGRGAEHRKVTYDVMAAASGIAPKVIGGEISTARRERDDALAAS